MKILTALKAAAIIPLLSSASFALTISTPLSLDPSYVVGTIDPVTPGNSVAQDAVKVQFLLDLTGPDGTLVTGDDGQSRHYETKHAGYHGTVDALDSADGNTASVPSGFDI